MKLVWRLVPFVFASLAMAQDFGKLDLKNQVSFLDIVEPIISKGERAIYNNLADGASKRYFEAIFWHKRDPDPGTLSNQFQTDFFTRRRIAEERLGEEGRPGTKTDRGKVLMLIGEPDDVKTSQLPGTGLRAGYEEVWTYSDPKAEIHFVLKPGSPHYELQNPKQLEPLFENLRLAYILDRAESYRPYKFPISLANLGVTKDIENLTAPDRYEIDFKADYYFLEGDRQKTRVMVGLTFKNASEKGMEISFSAFDPYENKAADIKKRIAVKNGEFYSFFTVLEPDQYKMVVRLIDRDGRQSISRQIVDVRRINPSEASASSLFLAPAKTIVPLEGFFKPKMFVEGNSFYDVSNLPAAFKGDKVHFMQFFYNQASAPKVNFYLDNQQVQPLETNWHQMDDGTQRLTGSLNVADPDQNHELKLVFPNGAGDLDVRVAYFGGETSMPESGVHQYWKNAQEGGFELQHPASNKAGDFDRVVIKAPDTLQVKTMYVVLNGVLILQKEKAPWEVLVDKGLFSISGQNTLQVIVKTRDGKLYRREKVLEPLKADEEIKTRVMRIYFNAFDENLKFLSDIDTSQIEVTVDDEPTKPLEIEKVDEPITYCLLIDTSFSMKESFMGNVEAVRKFIDAMRPHDKAYVVSFDNNYYQHNVPTPSKAVLKAVISSLSLQGYNPKFGDRIYQENETYLYDAGIAAIHTLLEYPGRQVILLVSDGIGAEGIYARHGLLSYAREHEIVIYSLWLDNNPQVNDEELAVLQKEMSGAERFARNIGLTRFFAKKDARKNRIGEKVRKSSITEGMLKVLAEESGGFHYRIFRTDRTMIRNYVGDIEEALANQYVMTLNLPIAKKMQHIDVYSNEEHVAIRSKSEVHVHDSNPLSVKQQ